MERAVVAGSSYRRAVIAAVIAAGIVMLGSASGAQARPRAAKPDLTVSSGAVSVAAGRLAGSFVVQNVGRASATTTSAELLAKLGSKQRSLATFEVRRLQAGGSTTVRVRKKAPTKLAKGAYSLIACADSDRELRQATRANDCRAVGTWFNGVMPPPAPTAAPTPTPAPAPPATPTPEPRSTVPTAPLASYPRDAPLTIGSYSAYVPERYDGSGQTPTTLLIWLHGCGGTTRDDLWNVAPDPALPPVWITAAPNSADGACWNVSTDPAAVLATIADIKTHFNVDPRRIIIGGYSSGGDLAYRTAFSNASTFAGLLAENTTPFRDTGSTQQQSIAAASWRFPIVQLAHLQDRTYPIATVRNETDALTNAGFPMTRIERDGGHYDAPNAIENGHAVPGTDADVRTYLLPHIGDGWLAPPG